MRLGQLDICDVDTVDVHVLVPGGDPLRLQELGEFVITAAREEAATARLVIRLTQWLS
jgi:hypothetical protein